MKVRVYVDGFNVYYRALKKNPTCKWLNPLRLSQSFLRPDQSIDCLRYFTALVSARAGDPDAPIRQQAYLSALGTIPEISIHYGRFLAKTKTRPLAANPRQFVEVLDSEEKGSDVNLATFLLMDGWRDKYDLALVLSQDTDLCEPLRAVKEELGKQVALVWLDEQKPNPQMKACCNFVLHVTRSRLRAAQLPSILQGANGAQIIKPASW